MRYDSIAHLLACPRCLAENKTSAINADSRELGCASCGLSFPTTGGLLWLFANPEGHHFEWKGRYEFFLQTIQQEIEAIKGELKQPGLLKETQDRLHRIVQAKHEHLKEVIKLLEPLEVSSDRPIEQSMALRVKLPETQNLMSYYQNVLRDWGWGEEENRISFAIVQQLLGEQKDLGTLAVFGAGAGRLAVDCHNRLDVEKTLAFDINPFLSFCLKRIIEGRALSLYEFPVAPQKLADFAFKVRCEAQEKTREGFTILLSDVMNPPLKDSALDTLLTPWLVDIVPQDSRNFFKRLNRVLRSDGRWINFGSLAYNQKMQSFCYSREEVLKLAEEAGFAIEQSRDDEIPYLQSPASCQRRREKIFCFVAKKVREVSPPQSYHYLPSWLLDPKEQVPVLPEMTQLVAVNRTFADLVALVDGKKSLIDMAKIIAPRFQMGEVEARELIRQLFVNIFESQQRRLT